VINATLLGVVEEARKSQSIKRLYGARSGISGLLNEDLTDLLQISPEMVAQISRTPGAALGSSRKELEATHIEQALTILRKLDIRCLFYNGGNGSMGTAHQIEQLASQSGYELQVIGVPKTIDNDIVGTDHTPGYGSAARFSALAVRDIGADLRSLGGQVVIIEILGRNVGWIVAGSTLGQQDADDPPHLVYFPEEPLPLDKFLGDVERVYRRVGHCLVAVCEGQLDEHGEAFGADVRSGSRGSLAMNLGHRLAMLVIERLKLRARSEKPGLLGRSSLLAVSESDWAEARLCGQAAVRAALEGSGGNMVTLERGPGNEYEIRNGLTPLQNAAFIERPVPQEWRAAIKSGNGDAFRKWALPLTGAIEPLQRLPRP
jgi:ATP-dependent phosphofructokinase / diphosphate-dependent phosphofructokinase